jgi:ketosteroid isomerase-like protein
MTTNGSTTGEAAAVERVAQAIAAAIGRKDVGALARMLAPGFVYRTPSDAPRDAARFLAAIGQIPGDIVFVRLENMTIDVADGGAVVTGIQHAQVRVDGKAIDDKRPFVDWFVKHDGEWLIRLALDVPASAT